MTVFHQKKFKSAANKSNRQIIREAKFMTALGRRSWLLLLGALAQVGGEITLSKGTQETVGALATRGVLTYEMVEGPGDGEYTIRLLNSDPGEVVAPVEPRSTHTESCERVTHPGSLHPCDCGVSVE